MPTEMSTASKAGQQAAGWVEEQTAYVFGMYTCAYGFPLVMIDMTRQVMTATQEMLDGHTENNLVTQPEPTRSRRSRRSATRNVSSPASLRGVTDPPQMP